VDIIEGGVVWPFGFGVVDFEFDVRGYPGRFYQFLYTGS